MSRQDELNRALLLATWTGKMIPVAYSGLLIVSCKKYFPERQFEVMDIDCPGP